MPPAYAEVAGPLWLLLSAGWRERRREDTAPGGDGPEGAVAQEGRRQPRALAAEGRAPVSPRCRRWLSRQPGPQPWPLLRQRPPGWLPRAADRCGPQTGPWTGRSFADSSLLPSLSPHLPVSIQGRLGCSRTAISSARCPVSWLTSPTSHGTLDTSTVQPRALHVSAKAPVQAPRTRRSLPRDETRPVHSARGGGAGSEPSLPAAGGRSRPQQPAARCRPRHALWSPGLGPSPSCKAAATFSDVAAAPPLLGNNF